MKKQADLNLELMTLPELRKERLELLDKIRVDKATVRDARRFAMLNGLVVMFEQAKLAIAFKPQAPDRPSSKKITPLFPPVDCDVCRHAKATIFMTETAEGKLRKSNYCDPCAEVRNKQMAFLLNQAKEA